MVAKARRVWMSIFAALVIATPAAAADCNVLIGAFDRAVASKSVDAELNAMAAIANDIVCGVKTDEYRGKLIDSLIDLAGDTSASAAERDRALASAQEAIAIGGTWRAAAHLADYYARRNDNRDAFNWYEKSLSFISLRPAASASAEEIRALVSRASAAKLLASDDDEGHQVATLAESTRGLDGRVGGIYSRDLLRGAEVEAVPLPINFFTNETRFTAVGEKAAAELAQAVKEQNIHVMILVGHADPRGDRQYNLALSKRRAEAVRTYLLAQGVSARIIVDGKGPDQPFDVSLLGRPVTQKEAWALDRRVEWVRDGATE
jgi:OOP family OmpA-OmpF porin